MLLTWPPIATRDTDSAMRTGLSSLFRTVISKSRFRAGRPPTGEVPLRTDGHAFTCTGLSDDEKHALEAYLLAH